MHLYLQEKIRLDLPSAHQEKNVSPLWPVQLPGTKDLGPAEVFPIIFGEVDVDRFVGIDWFVWEKCGNIGFGESFQHFCSTLDGVRQKHGVDSGNSRQ